LGHFFRLFGPGCKNNPGTGLRPPPGTLSGC